MQKLSDFLCLFYGGLIFYIIVQIFSQRKKSNPQVIGQTGVECEHKLKQQRVTDLDSCSQLFRFLDNVLPGNFGAKNCQNPTDPLHASRSALSL